MGALTVEVQPVTKREIEAELRIFEEKYGWDSEKFLEAFRNGRLRETPDFHAWSSAVEALRLLSPSL